MKQAVWRGMPYFDAFWRKRHLTRRELQSIFTSYYTYLFLVLVIAIMILLDMHGFAVRVSSAALVVYTISLCLLTYVFYMSVSIIGIKFSQRHDWFFVIYPLVGFGAITLATVVVELGMSSTFGGQTSLARVPEKWPVNLVFTLVIETLFITFVLPTVATSSPADDVPEKPIDESSSGSVIVAGNAFLYNKLISVSSQDHYVRICTKDGEKMIRARLSDLTEQLGSQNGIQPHRSHWVSREAAVEIESQNGHKVLKLSNGSRVPIARGRMRDVKAWLEN